MSVYLIGDNVLLNGGSVATDAGCCCGACVNCGDRVTIEFSGFVSGCLADYIWPMGLIDLSGTLYTWEAFADGGTGPFACNCVDATTFQIRLQCDSSGGWSFIAETNSAVTFSASDTGSFPIGIPISNSIGSGTVTITCGGAWGSCCACNDEAGTDCACWGCEVSPGFSGGMGEEQCLNIVGCAYMGPVTFNGDHSTCTPNPCPPFIDC